MTFAEWLAIPAEYKMVKPDGSRWILRWVIGVGTCLVRVEVAG